MIKKSIMTLGLSACIFCSSIPVSAQVTSLGKMKHNDGYSTYQYKDASILKNNSSALKKKASTLPTYFNLQDNGKVTDAKNQGSYNTCWTFGAMSSLESNILMQTNKETDLSEAKLATSTYLGADNSEDTSLYAGKDTFNADSDNISDILQQGGSRWFSVPTLVRNYGAVTESKLPYDSLKNFTTIDSFMDTLNTVKKITDYNIGDILYLEDPNNSITARNELKAVIQSKGAVSAGILFDSSDDYGWYNKETYGYNTSDESDFINPNHEITIIGWNDSYSKDNFINKPSQDGAWIVKNSWGTSFGKNGTMYVSYEDTSISEPTLYQTKKKDYDNLYQYDGVGEGTSMWCNSSKTTASNTYTSRGNETISQIGTYTPAANATVKAIFYDENNNQISTKTWSNISNAGYHQLSLNEDEMILVNKNQKFTVEIETTYNQDGQKLWFLPLEAREYESEVIFDNEGSSTIKSNDFNGNSINKSYNGIVELGDSEGDLCFGNALVKVYTNNQPTESIQLTYGDKLGSNKEFNWKEPDTVPEVGSHVYDALDSDGNIIQILVKVNSYTLTDNNIQGLKNSIEETGNAIIQNDLKVIVGDKALTNNDFTVSYKNNIKPGTATIIITGIGNYNGIVEKEFTITQKVTTEVSEPTTETQKPTTEKPKPTTTAKPKVTKVSLTKLSISKLKGYKKSLKVTFKKKNSGTKFQIQYSKYKNMKKSTTKNTSKTSYTIKKLSKKKKYYVRIRSYKKVNGKTYYSAWSKIKNCKTK